MRKLDEEILRAYFRYAEYQRQRLWLARLFHPEEFNWRKRGSPPPMTETKKIRAEELAKMGFDEAYYQRMLKGEKEAERELCELAEQHVLYPHFKRISGIGTALTTGKYVARGGDITRCPTVSSYWYGLGEDVLPNGTVPRRLRGRKNVERRLPALPHVTMIGEQIRQQILRSGKKLRELYDKHKENYLVKKPGVQKMYAHKHGLRIAMKILDSCAWKVWREAYGLPAPDPYAFGILKHDNGSLIRIEDLYDK